MGKGRSFEELMELAKEYGVHENAAVQELAARYQDQTMMLRKIRARINKDGLTTEKEYVKGRANVCANPLLDAWAKNNDTANRTLSTLCETIIRFGQPPERKESKLMSILKTDD